VSRADCVSFPNRQGRVLHGMLHCPPAESARGVCVLLLSPGIKGRAGPHRMYLKFAERVVPMGFHVLRFDFHGLGDSEGELPHDLLADMYNSIQAGRYVDDTVAAMDWMRARHGIDRFVGSGLCGGSITALLASVRDRRIRSLLGLGLPVVLDGGEANWGRFLTAHQTRGARRQLARRLLRPWTWLKFLSGRSNYRVIWRVMKQVAGFRDAGTAGPAGSGDSRSDEPGRVVDDTNPLFAPAFLELVRSGRPVLLVYSGADRLHAQFREKFEARHVAAIADSKSRYGVHVIPEANHILSDEAWVAEFLDVSARWLDEAHPRAAQSRDRAAG
jgi:uncharacterized protein